MSYDAGQAAVLLSRHEKQAGDTQLSYGLKGKLYKSKSGWILMQVPNALVRGAFEALAEPGIELPPSGSDGRLNAHVSVIRPEELDTIGGADQITERGQEFAYTLGSVRTVTPHGWSGMSKCWMIDVKSPDLEKLRKSYGLTAKPNDNKFNFHITIAVRKKNVLGPNSVRKAASIHELPRLLKRAEPEKKHIPTVAVDLDGTICKYDGWKGEDNFGEVRPGAKKALKKFQANGYRIIIFTTRGDTEAVGDFLHDNDIPYDYINENPDQPPNASGKVIADVYLDDRAVDARSAWSTLTTETEKRIEKEAELAPPLPAAEPSPAVSVLQRAIGMAPPAEEEEKEQEKLDRAVARNLRERKARRIAAQIDNTDPLKKLARLCVPLRLPDAIMGIAMNVKTGEMGTAARFGDEWVFAPRREKRGSEVAADPFPTASLRRLWESRTAASTASRSKD